MREPSGVAAGRNASGHDSPEWPSRTARWPGGRRIALTATATVTTSDEIASRLDLTSARHFVASFDRPNIKYRIEPKSEPNRHLLDLLRGEHYGDARIVYCLSRASVAKTAEFLSPN